MPTTNARRHTKPTGTEQSFNRGTLFDAFGNSIRDIVPVANASDRAQLVTDLTAAGQAPSSTKPLVVHRADARGAHRIEYTTESTGAWWMPASGLLEFVNKGAADSFGTSYGGLLSVGDRCVAAGARYRWSGSAWYGLSARMKRSATAKSITNASISQDLSTNNLWTEDWREAGIAAYSNGWTIPYAGEWEIDFGGQFSGAADLFISVNKPALGSFGDVSGYAQGVAGSAAVALPQGFKRLRCAAGDVIRIFGASVAASVNWDNSFPNQSWFGIRFIGD
ncbi:hypothetical protein [Microbacterium sp. NPDC057944]|uniref:hypothetical protein n=1 Tax=Microbacterium sp. NPDC057944 TaxID=3346286 RepID=UPI0036D95DEC